MRGRKLKAGILLLLLTFTVACSSAAPMAPPPTAEAKKTETGITLNESAPPTLGAPAPNATGTGTRSPLNAFTTLTPGAPAPGAVATETGIPLSTFDTQTPSPTNSCAGTIRRYSVCEITFTYSSAGLVNPWENVVLAAEFTSGAEIGAGTKIWHFCHIMPGARIGKKCNLGQNVFIASDVVIGNNVKIQNNVSVYTGVIIEDDVFLGPSMVFTNVLNPRSHVPRRNEYRTTLVKRGVSIGANATIVCGITLGRYAFVGAGSVVTREVPDYALVFGNPARVRGWTCQCGIKLRFKPNGDQERAVCESCGTRYVKSGEVVKALEADGEQEQAFSQARSREQVP